MLRRFIFFTLFVLTVLVSYTLAQTESETPEEVVQSYFQALGDYKFDEMSIYLHPELLEDVKKNVIYKISLGETDDLPHQLDKLSKEEVEKIPDSEVMSYMIPHILDSLGGSFDIYRTVRPVWSTEESDRAYVVISYGYAGYSDKAQSMMTLIPLKKVNDKWFMVANGELLIMNDLVNFNDY